MMKNRNIPDRLETTRLILRPYEDGDEEHFLNMLDGGNRDYLDELLGPVSQSKTSSEIKVHLEKLAADWKERNRFVLSYWDKQTSEYLGHVWIEPENIDLRIYEIGWFVRKEKQKNGFATEAVKKALGFIFCDLEASKVQVTVRDHGAYKIRSMKIAERCGFRKEGFIRDSVQVYTSKGPGPVVGVTQFGLLRSEAVEESYLPQ